MGLWIGDRGIRDKRNEPIPYPLSPLPSNASPHVLRNPSHRSWAYLRLARFNSRPGHADQLHLDLWWRGLNVAQDAGTYLYNAPPPWDNALMSAEVHNTLTVNDRDQMMRLGRFLYLDWAQAELIAHEQAEDSAWQRLIARHNGYHNLGVTHQRCVTAWQNGQWTIEDRLIPLNPLRLNPEASFAISLHWLLPDWPWDIEIPMPGRQLTIHLHSPHGRISLLISGSAELPSSPSLIPNALSPMVGESNTITTAPLTYHLSRAGALLHGSGPVSPTWGWVSPTYGVKIPALSLRVFQRGAFPLTFTSLFSFPEQA